MFDHCGILLLGDSNSPHGFLLVPYYLSEILFDSRRRYNQPAQLFLQSMRIVGI